VDAISITAVDTPRAILQIGVQLLNQQCWLWGQDVRHPDGDLLQRYGFSKHRRPATMVGSHGYRLDRPDGVAVVLWGFGMFYGPPERGIFLARHGFTPLVVAPLPHPPPTLPGELQCEPCTATDQPLLTALVGWVVAYERWVLQTCGMEYRRRCVELWPAERQIPAERIVSEWTTLAAHNEVPRRQLISELAHPVQQRMDITMGYTDKTIMCKDCGEPFVFTAGEQEFYNRKGFTNEPTRCAACRQAKKAAQGGGGGGYSGGYNSGGGGYGDSYGGGRSYSGRADRSYSEGQREMFTVPCSEPGCTKEAVVPFKPRGDKPVYCDDCFRSRRASTPRW
jgi:CxxC-x17-CxxC domain-containing protein